MPILIIVLTVGFLCVLAWAATGGGGGEALAWLTSNPWGITTLADLYLGIALFGVLVWRLERSTAKALLWLLPALLLGNVVPAVYVLLNLARIPAIARHG